MPLPIRMAAEFPPQLFATPIEDIDPFYSDKKVNCLARMKKGFPAIVPLYFNLVLQYILFVILCACEQRAALSTHPLL